MDDRIIDLWADDFTKNRKQSEKDTSLVKLVNNIIETRDFFVDLKELTFGRDLKFFRFVGVINCNELLDSISRTLESIRFCCVNTNFADAYSLLRKYRDDLFYYLYLHVVANNQDLLKKLELSNASKHERNIYDWSYNCQKNVKISDVLMCIAKDERVKKASRKYKLEQSLEDVRVTLNNYVHSNGCTYYNESYWKMTVNNSLKNQCDNFGKMLNYITTVFLFLLILISPGSVMAEDYVDYLDFGLEPPEGAQYWVAAFVVDYFAKHKDVLDEQCDKYLGDETGMQL